MAMNPLKLFISSVQKEFAAERIALAQYIREDTLLGSFFDVFLFEELAANNHSATKVYISEVAASQIYLGILGDEYGYEDAQGISPTEREYDEATNHNLQKWIFVKGNDDRARHPKEKAFVLKVSESVSRKRFSTFEELKKEVYNSCILYLKQIGKIDSKEFDESLNPDAVMEDIDAAHINRFVRMARLKRNFPLKETATSEEVLSHLNLLRNHQLTNSALLAFGKKPQHFFPAATVKCAHFHGFLIEKPIPDYKEFGGTVFEMAELAVDFVLSKISLSTGTRDISNQVNTTYEIPRRVIAEAIINAIAHRNYYSKASVQVSVFKDRIEVFNPGKLPNELELSDLSIAHGSYPHNPLLANCMFLTGDIERYGTGTLEIFHLLEEAHLSRPLFNFQEGFKVILYRPLPQTKQATIQDTIQDTIHDTIQDTIHDVNYFAFESLTHRLVWKIKGEMSRDELMTSLELKNRDNFQKSYIKPAIENGLIENTIPDKKTSKNQKYRLTKKGITLQKKLNNETK
jgi:predicted HTH transcriptional regulator